MAFLNPEERRFLETVSRLNYVNPFLPERIQYEREALGDAFDESKADWNLLGDDPEFHLVNTKKISDRAYLLLLKLQEQLRKGGRASRSELELYEDTVLFLVYHYYAQQFKKDVAQETDAGDKNDHEPNAIRIEHIERGWPKGFVGQDR